MLTRGKECDILSKLSRRARAKRSLKIEQQEESTSIEHGEIHVCVRTELDNSERNTTQTKSKEQSCSNEI